MKFTGTNLLAGNFMGGGRLQLRTGTTIQGGRFLGFPGFGNPKNIIDAGTVTALTTTAEPLVVPVVQLHSPSGKPDGEVFDGQIDMKWLQIATPTTFNAVFVMGDSPPRPLLDPAIPAQDKVESNGGLGNFPRFLEAWSKKDYADLQPATISGGFIQFKRSEFATAPFEALDNVKTDTSLFFDGAIPAYMANFDKTDYRYRGGSSLNKAPYYMPPDRQWGYDVGLLSQTPDLFSRRFVTPQAGTPNEFYREVPRDDKWVQTLLCASTVDTNSPVLPPGQRPASCPTQ